MMLDAHAIADALCQQGYWVGKNCLDTQLIAALAAEIVLLDQSGAMQIAGVGRGAYFQRHAETRSDTIHWLTGSSLAQQQYLETMGTLRTHLNRELMLGLFEYEAHFACYAPGAFYKKHVDSFSGNANRVISTVTYLNADWPADGGGELQVFDESGHERVRVLPTAGTMAIFLSEKIPHAVRAASVTRYSIAGWFRVNASTGQKIDFMR